MIIFFKGKDKICFKENSGLYTTRGVLRGEKKCFVVHLFFDENAIKIKLL